MKKYDLIFIVILQGLLQQSFNERQKSLSNNFLNLTISRLFYCTDNAVLVMYTGNLYRGYTICWSEVRTMKALRCLTSAWQRIDVD